MTNIYRWFTRFKGFLCRLLPLLVLALLSACQAPSLHFSSGVHPPLKPLVKVTSEKLLAWSPDGQQLAVEDQGLKILDLVNGTLRPTAFTQSDCIAWGVPGLANATSRDERFRIQLLDAAGETRDIAAGEGVVVDLAWGRDQILYALVVRQKYFRFGVNQRSFLLTLQPGGAITEELLGDETLKPTTPQLFASPFPFGPRLKVSPFGDEIVYWRLHDPPAFGPSYRVVLRHISSGREQLLGRLALNNGTMALLDDGESLLFSDGQHGLICFELWGGEQTPVEAHDTPVRVLEVAGGSRYLDGSLYRSGQRIWQLSEPFPARFSPDGSRLAILAAGWLYLTELEPRVEPQHASDALLKLRRLRALGLISSEDYRFFRKEL